MGLSSSQGRLLMLTSRLSDIELAQIMISQRQNQLAWDRENVSKEYNDAVSNYKLTIKVPDASKEDAFVKEDLNFENMYDMGYRLVDAKGNIYLPPGYQKDDGTAAVEDNFGTDTKTLGDETYIAADATPYMENSKLLQEMIMNGLLFVYNTNEGGSTEPLSMSQDSPDILL